MKIFENEAPYEKLKFYQDICELRRWVYNITEHFARANLKLTSQMRDAARSAKQNVREGYRRGSLKEFIRALKISQGSLDELIGDIEDCHEDSLITNEEFETLSRLSRSAAYLLSRYVKSLYSIDAEGTWRVPGLIREPSAPYFSARNYCNLSNFSNLRNLLQL